MRRRNDHSTQRQKVALAFIERQGPPRGPASQSSFLHAEGEYLAAPSLALSPLVRVRNVAGSMSRSAPSSPTTMPFVGALGTNCSFGVSIRLPELMTLAMPTTPPSIWEVLDDKHDLLAALRQGDSGAAVAAVEQRQRVRDVVLADSWAEATPTPTPIH
jgi:hypothetical protein